MDLGERGIGKELGVLKGMVSSQNVFYGRICFNNILESAIAIMGQIINI